MPAPPSTCWPAPRGGVTIRHWTPCTVPVSIATISARAALPSWPSGRQYSAADRCFATDKTGSMTTAPPEQVGGGAATEGSTMAHFTRRQVFAGTPGMALAAAGPAHAQDLPAHAKQL